MKRSTFTSALLVEDEPSLATALQIALKKLKIYSFCVSTLSEAQRVFKIQKPDFILLDRTLPDGDGLEFCKLLRNENYHGAILILTASGKTEDRIHGLNAGADDYLPKPFSWEELEARINALARRQTFFQTDLSETALWKVDETRLSVLGPKGWVILTPLEFKLASRLIDQKGKIVSRADLLKNVWGFTLLPKTRTVDHFLGRLRKHFEENPEQPIHFLTIRGAGYKFEK